MKATRFMRQPFFVAGYQVDPSNMDELAKWCGGHVIKDNTDKPFILVPVNRPTNVRQTEAYVGMWILLSKQHGIRSFKVYHEDALRRSFFELPDDDFDLGEMNLAS